MTGSRRGAARLIRSLLPCLLLFVVAGCSPGLPRDPEGTLLRATGGTVVVGVSENPPHTHVSDDGAVSGTEVDIVEAWAATIDADVEWVPGAESVLMAMLEEGEVDVVVGGLTSDSPWTTHAALTRPYAQTTGPDGKAVELVIAARMGENSLLVSIETFLVDEGLEP